MTHRQKIRAKILYENDILTPLERRRKALAMANKGLSKEKIEEIQSLIERGETIKMIAATMGVSNTTVGRIKAGMRAVEDKPAPKPNNVGRELAPAAPSAALEAAQERISPRELDALRALIGQAVKAFAGIECATAADSYNLGQTFGLLTAAQMILGDDEI